MENGWNPMKKGINNEKKHRHNAVIKMICIAMFCCKMSYLYVTPRHRSTPTHRAGREPGTPAREAGALTRNSKGYSL